MPATVSGVALVRRLPTELLRGACHCWRFSRLWTVHCFTHSWSVSISDDLYVQAVSRQTQPEPHWVLLYYG